MMKNQIALFLRVFLLYPAGALMGILPSVDFDRTAGLLTIDLTATSLLLGGFLYAAVTGGTFGWSRFLKLRGGAV